MMRLAATAVVGALVASLGIAPVQCAHKPDPDVRREDGPDDALWALAHDFRAKEDEAAARATLRYLAEKYPASRYAAQARAESGGAAASSATAVPSAKP